MTYFIRCFFKSLLFSLTSLFFFVATAQNSNDVMHLLEELSSPAPMVVSEAQKRAPKFLYQEVFNKLVENIEFEIAKTDGRGTPNTYILISGLEALVAFSGPDQKSKIYTLIQSIFDQSILLEPILGDSWPHVVTAMNNLETHLLTDAAHLSSLQTKQTNSLAQKIQALPKGSTVLAGTVEIVRDQNAKLKQSGQFIPVIGRDREALEVLQGLARLSSANVLLSGPAGAGKTSIAKHIDEMSLHGQIPQTQALEPLQNLIVLETSPGRISSLARSDESAAQAYALESYIDAVQTVQKALGQPVIIFVDEAHAFSYIQVEALKRFTGGQNEVRFIFASTSQEFMMRFKNNGPFLRRVKTVVVEELPVEQVIALLKESWIPIIQTSRGVVFSERVIRRAVEEATKLFPHGGRVDGSIKLLDDFAIEYSPSKHAQEPVLLDREAYSEFVKQYYRLPVDPRDFVSTRNYFRQLEEKINSEVLEQTRMVSDVLTVFKQMLQSSQKNVSSVGIIGKTGTGKTLVAEMIANEVLDNPQAVYTIKGTDQMNGGLELNTEFGAPNGIISSDVTPGEFISWLEDESRGGRGGILIIDEGEKAHLDFWRKIMELQDQGRIKGGDGKFRFARNLLIIVTFNKGVDMIFPKGWDRLSTQELHQLSTRMTSDKIKEIINLSPQGQTSPSLPPENLNRFDLFSLSMPFSKDTANKVLKFHLDKEADIYLRDYSLTIEVSSNTIDHLTHSLYNPEFAARPLKRGASAFMLGVVEHMAENWGTVSDLHVTVTFDPVMNEYSISSPEKKTIQLHASVNTIDDPLLNTELVAKLENFESLMKKHIFGQDRMIRRLANVVLGYFGMPQVIRKKARSLFLIGTTGGGKSETAHILALILHESRDRLGYIPLGNITNQFEFNDVFSPPKGAKDADTSGLFEKFLIANPEGGVLLFEEASNMGGNNRIVKNELFKKLYEITDRPTWTSRATGATYDLTKYLFLFLGNDGEHLFRNVGSDDLRMSLWRNYQEESKARQILVQAGVPEAFLGRIGDVIMMEPIVRKSAALIAQNFFKAHIEEFSKMGINLVLNDKFLEDFAFTFLTQDQGSRSIDNTISSQLNTLFVQARQLLKARGIKKGRFVLDIIDNLAGRTFLPEGVTERQVTLRVVLQDISGETISELNTDATHKADPIHLMTKDQATKTAFHEAGHALLDDPITGQRFEYMSIVGRGNYFGYARFQKTEGSPNLTYQGAIAILSQALAGTAAQQLAGYPIDDGMARDIQHARELAKKVVVDYGMVGGFSSLLPDYIGAQEQLKIQQQVESMFSTAWRHTVEQLMAQWPVIETVVMHLLKEGELSANDLEKIKKSSPAAKAAPSQEKASKVLDFMYAGSRSRLCSELF